MGGQFAFPVPAADRTAVEKTLSNLFSANHRMKIGFQPQHSQFILGDPAYGLFQSQDMRFAAIASPTDTFRSYKIDSYEQSSRDDIPTILANILFLGTYVFKAERLGVHTYQAQEAGQLIPDASNLPAALQRMTENPGLWETFNSHVSEIFQNVHRVTVQTRGSSFNIHIWPFNLETARSDRTVSLEHAGTGVGQVLAILFVIMTRPKSVIVIDEPNSFLHPGAAKKLIQIMQQYDHQYIISTHSADLISACEPRTIHMVQWSNNRSEVRSLDPENISHLQAILSELGVSILDIFGVDRLLWVEGPTEEACFPLLIREALGSIPKGLAVRSLRATGDIVAKRGRAELAREVYSQVSKAHALNPSSIFFSLDRELLGDEECTKLINEFKGRLRFLPRRMIENYFISPKAIAAVVGDETSQSINSSEIDEWIKANGRKYCRAPTIADFSSNDCLMHVDGGSLLRDLFHDKWLIPYNKRSHGAKLAKFMIQHETEAISELVGYVKALLGDWAAHDA